MVYRNQNLILLLVSIPVWDIYGFSFVSLFCSVFFFFVVFFLSALTRYTNKELVKLVTNFFIKLCSQLTPGLNVDSPRYLYSSKWSSIVCKKLHLQIWKWKTSVSLEILKYSRFRTYWVAMATLSHSFWRKCVNNV